MCELQATVKDDFKVLSLESTTKKITETIDKVKDDFMYIGFLLWECNNFKYYEAKGYSSIVDYAEKELNFKQASTYNFISICEKFSEKRDNGYPTMHLDKRFKDYNFTQLVEIKSLNFNQIDSISPTMSTREIRQKKKEIKSKSNKDVPVENNVIDVEFIQSENKDIEVVQEVSFVQLDYKENVIKYLIDRLGILKDLVKSDKKNLEFKGALHEVDLLLDCISKDEI